MRNKEDIVKYVKQRLNEKDEKKNKKHSSTIEELELFLESIQHSNLLTESLMFDEEEDMPVDKPMPKPEPEVDEPVVDDVPTEEPDVPADEPEMDGGVDAKIAQIRKAALEIVTQLADNVEDPNYELAKKIWMMCDKKNTDAKKESNSTDNN